ncbi:IclR family transcriptional regulator [Pectobacterium sp. B1J-3]|uniref:IclR family transcriptional regulator n=1 Tax=Pectobacterium sp. B1J-3 TaxID=3385371 RepID=UPI003906624A
MEKINRSVARALDMLELVANTHDELTITEISKQLGIPKSTTFDIIYTLVDKGYLDIANPRVKSFKLGLKLFQTGAVYLDQTPFYEVARPILEDLAAKAQETSFLAMENDGFLVYLDKVESAASVRTSARIGSNNPMYCTGLGKALLASMSDEQVKAILQQTGGLKPVTPFTIVDETRFFGVLNEARQRGYVIDDREHNSEVFCVAAPIYNARGKTQAAISIASLFSKVKDNPSRVEELGQLISEAALSLSRRIGFRGEQLFEEFR